MAPKLVLLNSALPPLKPHRLSLIEHLLYAQHSSMYFRVLISLVLNTVRHVAISILFIQKEIEAQTG